MESRLRDLAFEHHRRAIERQIERYREDPRFPALIVGGSVVRGTALAGSDVDLVLVATPEEAAERARTRRGCEVDMDAGYEGGYVDLKIVGLDFLRDVAERGSEPARWAFSGAWIGYSRIDGLEDLLRRIPVYPAADRQRRIDAFMAQVALLAAFFVPEATKRSDPYLMAHAATRLALFASRLILAHNERLFPNHKWLLHELERAPEKPEGFVDQVRALLARPEPETAKVLFTSILTFRDWGFDWSTVGARFVEEDEWAWREGRAPLTDW